MVATVLTLDDAASIDLQPKSTYELLTREKLEHLADDVGEIRSRVNSIFFLVIGSVAMDLLLRWLP